MDFFSILLEPTFWIGIFLVAFYSLYRYGTSTFHVFSEQGIPGPCPVPFIGNMWGAWKQNMVEEETRLVKKYGKVFGFFEGLEPQLFISDPDIIKGILVKDFDHFVNHQSGGHYTTPTARKMVVFLKDKEWRDVRTSISPSFSPGKIKQMSGHIKEYVDKAVAKLADLAREEGKIEAKRFSVHIDDDVNSVISRCAFGLNIENLGEKEDPFVENAMNLFGDITEEQTVSMLLPYVLPQSAPEEWFATPSWKFFIDVVNNVINERSQTKEKFNDFLEICTQSLAAISKEGDGRTVNVWSQEEINELVAAQALEFLIDGYETTAQAMALISFELARHPDIQERLYKDVMNILDQFGEVSHEMIQEVPYAEQIIYEILRLHPASSRIDRECNRDISYKGFVIKKGMKVQIPIYVLHHSEEYFPDPETFNPDRWSPENKEIIDDYTYLPFGKGPRGCMGFRFAIEQMKLAICTLIQKFEFFPAEETLEKMQFRNGFLPILIPTNTTVGVRLR